MVGLSVSQNTNRHNTKTKKYKIRNHLTPNLRITDITMNIIANEDNMNVRQPFSFPMIANFSIVEKYDYIHFATSNFT